MLNSGQSDLSIDHADLGRFSDLDRLLRDAEPPGTGQERSKIQKYKKT